MKRQKARAVRGAYDYADDSRPCPSCGAEPFVFCKQASGEPRHVPCVARLKKPEPGTDIGDAYE